MPSKSRPSPAVEYVTSGTYQRQDILNTTITSVVGTEQSVSPISSIIIANTANKNELFSWIRLVLFQFEQASHYAYEWALVKLDSSASIPDLNDEPTAEKLHREKRIFARGYMHVANPNYSPVKPLKFEIFNVSLNYGEELRLLIKPIIALGTATTTQFGLLEWRQVGI